MARTVAVVAHTHWDREWYAPFETFRRRLVVLLDDLIELMDSNPEYTRFLLDGQMAVVDDYLEIRPKAVSALQRLTDEGRLTMGPWYVLMDEFGVSAETIVRNLQLGLRRAAAFGGAMAVGYLPDMFGHVAQMPQLLRQAGFEHAVVWRGVPAAVRRTGFWWSAPDGSRLRAEYLPVGYANGAHLPRDAGDLVRRVAAHEDELATWLRPTDPLLVMAGTDHQIPQPALPALLGAANEAQERFEFGLRSLAEYLAEAPTDELPEWRGELRSSARANLLMGVASNRVDVKIAAARAERALERRAEPLAALWLPAELWPEQTLEQAWLEVIRNSAHDTICACSADDVGLAALHRYAEATELADGVSRRALELAALAVGDDGPTAVNPTAVTRSGVVTAILPFGVDPTGALGGPVQMLTEVPPRVVERAGLGADLARLLGELGAEGGLPSGQATQAALAAGPDGVTLVLTMDRSRRRGVDVPSVMAEAWAQAGAHATAPLRVRVDVAGWREVAVLARDVPGFGWKALRTHPADGPPPVTAGEAWLDNGVVRVTVDGTDGTLAVHDRRADLAVSGLGRLVDGGDAGDTYNYSPPAVDRVIASPDGVRVSCLSPGPVLGRLRIERDYTWPAALNGEHRSDRMQPVLVTTDVELRAGERLVRADTHFDNPSRDHRLRVHFPLPFAASESSAECAFGVVRRGLTAESGPGEHGLPTFPCRRWVAAGGLTVTHEGLLEYELVDDGAELAVTLLRATGMLSRPAPAYRPNPAGPSYRLEGPQLVGPIRARWAVALGEDMDGYRLADDAWVPLEVVNAPGGGACPPAGSHLAVTGAEVSSLRRVDGGLEIRVFNPSDETTEVRVEERHGWLVDLRGARLARWSGRWPLGPWAIATARLDPDGAPAASS